MCLTGGLHCCSLRSFQTLLIGFHSAQVNPNIKAFTVLAGAWSINII
jgi:hypothetical protein